MSEGERDRRGEATVPLDNVIAEARRVLSICNACRYCEGYCAVFPALERRLSFDEDDVHYLANLCHNCGACLYACQYAPPHEFRLNLPRVLAVTRRETYRKYAWPTQLGSAFARNGTVVSIIVAMSIASVLAFAAWRADPARFLRAVADSQGSFYAIVPHGAMVGVFGALFAFAVIALIAASTRFARAANKYRGPAASGAAFVSAGRSAATLEYLEGGGDGCTYPNDRPSLARRNFHHLTFYGFLLCFAATVVATFDHYVLGQAAPYPFFSAPVLLGTIGGLGLLIGPAGLLALMLRRDSELGDRRQRGMDIGFVVLLFVTSASGLLLLALRETRAMGALLVVHLGAVMALFLTLAYGKFVHAVFRFAALVRFHRERTEPVIGIGSE